ARNLLTCRGKVAPVELSATTAPWLFRTDSPRAGLPMRARISLRVPTVKGGHHERLWHDVALALDQGLREIPVVPVAGWGSHRNGDILGTTDFAWSCSDTGFSRNPA